MISLGILPGNSLIIAPANIPGVPRGIKPKGSSEIFDGITLRS